MCVVVGHGAPFATASATLAASYRCAPVKSQCLTLLYISLVGRVV